jgi:NADH dehydrogenase
MAWVIVRPGVIYGPDRRGVFWKLEQHVEGLPVIPVIGSGRYRQDPVHVDDVAGAAVSCVERADELNGRTFDLGGADSLSFNDVLDEIMAAKGLRKRKLHLPVWVCRVIATVSKRVLANPPLTNENIEGLLTAPPLDIAPARAAFGYAPRTFAEGFRETIAARHGDARRGDVRTDG